MQSKCSYLWLKGVPPPCRHGPGTYDYEARPWRHPQNPGDERHAAASMYARVGLTSFTNPYNGNQGLNAWDWMSGSLAGQPRSVQVSTYEFHTECGCKIVTSFTLQWRGHSPGPVQTGPSVKCQDICTESIYHHFLTCLLGLGRLISYIFHPSVKASQPSLSAGSTSFQPIASWFAYGEIDRWPPHMYSLAIQDVVKDVTFLLFTYVLVLQSK